MLYIMDCGTVMWDGMQLSIMGQAPVVQVFTGCCLGPDKVLARSC